MADTSEAERSFAAIISIEAMLSGLQSNESRIRRTRSLLSTGIASGLGWALCLVSCGESGCSSDGEPVTPVDAGTEGGTGGDGGVPPWDAGGGDAGLADTCDAPQPPRPDVIPEGWTAWTCSPGCPLWLPPNKENMPPPIEWVPCEGIEQPQLDCRQMKIDWTSDTYSVFNFPKLDVAPDGTARLMFERRRQTGSGSPDSYRDLLIAETDGPVRFAARLPVPLGGSGCSFIPEDYRGDRLVAIIWGSGTGEVTDSPAQSLMVVDPGSVTPRLPCLEAEEDVKANWAAGGRWIVGEFIPGKLVQLYEPDLGETPMLLHSPSTDPDGLPMSSKATIVGDHVLIGVGTYSMAGIMAYDEALGYHPLIRWYGDTSRGAANIGSDGVDMVWTVGEDKPPGEPIYPTRHIMTSSFTTDPSKIEQRRLRSDPSGLMGLTTGRFAVGCGFAGRTHAVPRDELIVRLEDGWSWELLGNDDWKWGQILGFTCDEVFVSVLNDTNNIARIRLDSLGPGMAPD